MPDIAIAVRGLSKRYGDVEAVDGVDLDVREGTCLGFLGPNGAGKTTTVEILEGYRSRSGGEVSVLGIDPARADARWRARIGVVLQSGSPQPALTPRETLRLWGAYYPRPRPVADILELVGLEEKADERVATLSGGQRRRLEVALALIGDPELVFLDEPTTGFDPDARRLFWTLIGGLREQGKTILLTTHNMEEAEVLADRVAIIKDGRIVAEGTPDGLTAERGLPRVSFQMPPAGTAESLPGGLGGEIVCQGDRAELRTATPSAAVAALAAWAARAGEPELRALRVSRPSLEDVYLEIVR